MKNKRFLMLILAGMVSVQVVGCGLFANNENEKNSEVVTENETETEETTESQASSETEIESETQVATNDNSEKESEKVDEKESEKESEKVDENKEETKPTHTCNFATLNSDANNHWYVCSCGKTANSGAHGYTDEYDADCNTCGHIRSVPERPVEPETPSVPGSSVNWNGGDITLENVGIKIPTLTEFNKTGLESSDSDWWWTGHEDDKTALSAMNRIYMTCDEVFAGLVSKGVSAQSVNAFTATRNQIWFSWSDGNYRDFSLTRDAANGYYILEINRDLRNDPYGVWQLENWNKDIVKTMLSFVTPNVNQVFDYLWGSMYKDIASYPMYTDRYVTVSDCKIKLDKYFVYGDGKYSHVKFYIAPK